MKEISQSPKLTHVERLAIALGAPLSEFRCAGGRENQHWSYFNIGPAKGREYPQEKATSFSSIMCENPNDACPGFGSAAPSKNITFILETHGDTYFFCGSKLRDAAPAPDERAPRLRDDRSRSRRRHGKVSLINVDFCSYCSVFSYNIDF